MEQGAGDTDAVAKAVEPSVRAAAATAEANRDWKGAAHHWRTLYARNPEDKGLALSLARALRYAGQPQQGADLLQQAIARLGRNPALVTELAKCWLASDRTALALKTLEEAGRLAPNDWEVHSTHGVALDSTGRFAEAKAAYARALALSPENPAVLNNLALSQAMAGRLDQGIATLSRAQEQPEASLQTRQNLALLLALKGDAASAERMASKDLPPEMVRANLAYFRYLAGGVAR
jgi:Flp pilus assembly protein TadD